MYKTFPQIDKNNTKPENGTLAPEKKSEVFNFYSSFFNIFFGLTKYKIAFLDFLQHIWKDY
jgi:hypothetical protein